MSEWIGMKTPLKNKRDVKDNSICPSVTIFNVSKKKIQKLLWQFFLVYR